jgi:hypothetical protein
MAKIHRTKSDVKTIRGELLTVEEVSKHLHVSTRWIERNMNNGTFPLDWYPISVRKRCIDSADVQDFLQKIRVSAGTVPLPPKSEKEILLDELTS